MEVGSVMLVQTAVGGWLVARTQACDHAVEEEASQTLRENTFSPVVSKAVRVIHITNISQDRRLLKRVGPH